MEQAPSWNIDDAEENGAAHEEEERVQHMTRRKTAADEIRMAQCTLFNRKRMAGNIEIQGTDPAA